MSRASWCCRFRRYIPQPKTNPQRQRTMLQVRNFQGACCARITVEETTRGRVIVDAVGLHSHECKPFDSKITRALKARIAALSSLGLAPSAIIMKIQQGALRCSAWNKCSVRFRVAGVFEWNAAVDSKLLWCSCTL